MVDRHQAISQKMCRCGYCGARVATNHEAVDVVELGGGVELAVPFCSDTCENTYKARFRENIEDFDELHRAGAT